MAYASWVDLGAREPPSFSFQSDNPIWHLTPSLGCPEWQSLCQRARVLLETSPLISLLPSILPNKLFWTSHLMCVRSVSSLRSRTKWTLEPKVKDKQAASSGFWYSKPWHHLCKGSGWSSKEHNQNFFCIPLEFWKKKLIGIVEHYSLPGFLCSPLSTNSSLSNLSFRLIVETGTFTPVWLGKAGPYTPTALLRSIEGGLH